MQFGGGLPQFGGRQTQFSYKISQFLVGHNCCASSHSNGFETFYHHLWLITVYRLLACGGHLKHLALDHAPDLFKIPVAREEEDAPLTLPQLRNLAVAYEDRRRVRVVGAELEAGHSPVEEQDFLRQVESEAR